MADAAGALSTLHDAARATERSNGAVRALAGAKAHAIVAGQVGFDLVRARVAVSKAEEAVRLFKSPAADSALVFMRPELQQLEAAFDGERVYQRRYRQIAAGLHLKLGGARASKLGEFALAAEKVASQSGIGRSILSTGKILALPWVSRSLLVLGVGISAVEGALDAPTQSPNWQKTYGATAGAFAGVAEMRLEAAVSKRGANPAALLFDPAVTFGARALGLGDAGEKITIGKFFDEGAKAVTALTQGIATGDTQPMSTFHKQSMAGNGSTILQGYSMIGEALSRMALVDTAITKVVERKLPSEFKTSPSWWEAAKSDGYSVFEAVKGAAITLKEAVSD